MNINHLDDCVMIDTLALRVSGVGDLHKLPKRMLQADGPETSKYAKGNLQTDKGKVTLKAFGLKTKQQLCIEGSPAYHFQNHNVISSGDATMLSFAALRAVKEEYGIHFETSRAADFVAGYGLEVTRIDTPVLIRMPEGLNKGAVINAIAFAGIHANHNTSVFVGESVYFDQSSQGMAVKLYDKFKEVESRRRSNWPKGETGKALTSLAQQTLRMEAVYRLKYLKRRFGGNAPEPAKLHPDELGSMMHELFEKYDLHSKLRRPLGEDQLLAIIPRFRKVASWWQSGYDVLKIMENNASEYSRARTYLLRNHSFDIYGPPPTSIEDSVELGDIFTPKNILPVPGELRANPTLFFQLDMGAEADAIRNRLAIPS